jgi:nucleoside-diphosphate-sugar epimerase
VKILVTGAGGFVGRWLLADLVAAGHEIASDSSTGRVDVTAPANVIEWIAAAAPDAIVHLAAVAAPREVDRDVPAALEVAVAGTANVIRALAASPRGRTRPPVLLVAGSSEIYGNPERDDLPIDEATPARPRTTYALTKLAQEGIALGHGSRAGLRVVVARSFQHIGPGQRAVFAIPAFANRILEAANTGASTIEVGNIDVRRDLTDVRDVVAAYRRLLEVAAAGGTPADGLIVNVASGRAVALRDVVRRLAEIVGVDIEPVVNPELVRFGEAPEIVGNSSRLTDLTGWRPRFDLDGTLMDVIDGLRAMGRTTEIGDRGAMPEIGENLPTAQSRAGGRSQENGLGPS